MIAGEIKGFFDDQFRIPALTILALEEPENHLAPYFLARILRQTQDLTKTGALQAIVTSHSPSILGRVKPEQVRYCRNDPDTQLSSVKSVEMPAESEQAVKFVRSAMLAYPELYFARFVLLVEGDSEQIVLSRFAKAHNLLLDPSFVAIVPLGGRHVQHFWKLLRGLDIPYATLLDLDLGRDGAGFGRIKDALRHLLETGTPKEELLNTGNGKMLTDEEFDRMHTWGYKKDHKSMLSWIALLERYGVYYSTPLDLDLLMLYSFPSIYSSIVPKGGGPRTTVETATDSVLGTKGPGRSVYTGSFASYTALFPHYRYHFLTKSKPATHLAALASIEDNDLAQKTPKVLRDVLEHIRINIRKG